MRFDVPNMSCGHCVAKITEAVRRLDVAAEVLPDLAARSLILKSVAGTASLSAAIAAAGYPNTPQG